jgi:hypothetical protein
MKYEDDKMTGRGVPDGRRARQARLFGLVLLSVGVAGAAAFLLLPLALRLFVASLVMTTNACIWFAVSLSAGADWWTIAGTVARSARDGLATSEALGTAAILVLVGAVAMWGLQRLLGPEEE